MANLTKCYKCNKSEINDFLTVLSNLNLNYEFLKSINNDLINNEYYLLIVDFDENIEIECKIDNVNVTII
jgi:hypothetical protein